MRKNVWLVLLMVMVLPALLFTVSCGKKQVEAAPAATQPTGISAEEQAAKDRLAAEAAAMHEAFKAFTSQDITFDFDITGPVLGRNDDLLIEDLKKTATLLYLRSY